jgi:AcrR family transcriptional regulator
MKADPSSVDKTSSGAGRPRDPRIDAAILRATADLLVEIGYSNLTMAAVADRAGTTKTALYRRWSSKAELVHEAAFPAAPTAIDTPPGDITADIHAMVAATRDVFTSPVVRAALPGLIADMTADSELNDRVRDRFADAFAAVRKRLTDAVARGEVHADVDPDRLVEVIGGATLLRILLRPDEPLGDVWIDQTTAIVVHGVVA